MSYQEKRALVCFSAISLVFFTFCYVTYKLYGIEIRGNLNDLRFWAKFALFLFLSLIATKIAAAALFALAHPRLTGENLPRVFDERDMVIELKSIWLSHCMLVLGFLVSLGTLAFGMQAWVFFVALSVSGYLAAATTEIAQLFLYRTGE